MKTHAYVHRRVDRIETKEFGLVNFGVVCLFIIHLFLQIFSNLVVVYS